MNIRFKIRNYEALQTYLKTVPYGALRTGLKAFTEYILGDESHGLKHADPYKYVSRASAYGYTGARFENGNPVPAGYFSAKQFRYVAAITNGFTDRGSKRKTPTSPTMFEMVETNGGYGYSIISDTAGAYYARSDSGQARQLEKVGWRKVTEVLKANTAGAIRHSIAEVKRYLASK